MLQRNSWYTRNAWSALNSTALSIIFQLYAHSRKVDYHSMSCPFQKGRLSFKSLSISERPIIFQITVHSRKSDYDPIAGPFQKGWLSFKWLSVPERMIIFLRTFHSRKAYYYSTEFPFQKDQFIWRCWSSSPIILTECHIRQSKELSDIPGWPMTKVSKNLNYKLIKALFVHRCRWRKCIYLLQK